MSKSITLTEAQIGFIGERKELVVTQVNPTSFDVVVDKEVLTVDGAIDKLKVASFVVVKDGQLYLKGTEVEPTKRHNPSPEAMAEAGY